MEKTPFLVTFTPIPLNTARYIFSGILILFPLLFFAQTKPYTENMKWGIKENDKVIVEALYDTVFNYDSTGKVCLVCFKTKTASASKFIKMMITTYSCNYLNKKRKRLTIKTQYNDTCTVFALGKNTIKQYNNGSNYLIATIKGKKYLADKNFHQLTFNAYHEISLTPEPNFYITQTLNEWDAVLTGMVDAHERLVIPYQYSNIKVNPYDSLIVACSAGLRPNSPDDVYRYNGKKIETFLRHIDMATKNFIIHKIYDPKEHYILHNLHTKEEKTLEADELVVQPNDEILIRIKNDWFVYNMLTNQKTPKPELENGKNKGSR
jgi:hypothetical protein